MLYLLLGATYQDVWAQLSPIDIFGDGLAEHLRNLKLVKLVK